MQRRGGGGWVGWRCWPPSGCWWGGQTVLTGRLEGVSYLLYWLVCFGLTFFAILVALWDARALRQRSRREHRDLLHNTLGEIITEAKAREAGASGEQAGKGTENRPSQN